MGNTEQLMAIVMELEIAAEMIQDAANRPSDAVEKMAKANLIVKKANEDLIRWARM